MINDDLDGKSAELRASSSRKPPWKVKSFLMEKNEKQADETNVKKKILETLKDEASSDNSSQKVETTTYMLIYQHILKFLFLTGRVFGIKGDYEWKTLQSFGFWYAWINLFIIWSFIIYSFLLHYLNGDKIRMMEPIAVIGQVVACTQNMYMLKHWHRMLALILNFRTTCRRNTSESQAKVIEIGLSATFKMVKIFCLSVWGCVGFFLIAPIKSYFVDQVYMPLMPLQVMFCDQSKLFGYLAANFVLAELGTLSSFGTNFFGSIFIVLIAFYTIKIKLLRKDFADLDKMWDDKNDISLAYKRAFIRNIARKRQDMNDYLKNLKDMYEVQLLIYFFFNYISQIVCLFEVIEKNWLPGYSLITALFLQMLFYCFMGTKLSTANEEFRDMIWETKWYLYDRESKRLILMMLQESLANKDIKLGPLGSLNLVTGVTIFRSIYYYYTVLTELF